MSKCHNCEGQPLEIPKDAKKIVLVGNPNVGKSVFFNALTGIYVDVSNYPGTTVDISVGRYKSDVVIDTPGVYGVSSFNDEERVARDVILDADLILNVVDAVHLDRDLFLTLQLIDMGKPIIIALNMMDEVKRNGQLIDIERLEEILGVPVIPTIATKNIGIDKVKENLYSAKVGKRGDFIKLLMNKYGGEIERKADLLMILEGDEEVTSKYNVSDIPNMREEIYRDRRSRVDKIVAEVISEIDRGADFKILLSRWMMRPLTGIPILLFSFFLMYELIGVFIAQTVVGFTEDTIMNGYYVPFITSLMSKVVPSGTLFGEVLIGEFGLLTMTVTYVLGLLLPLVVGFYFFLSIMEDSGYLPRVAALVDRVLNYFGLNGKAVIPMILGFGCVTMATITTRILGSKRERIIATMLLGLAIPCSAQLGVIAALISRLGLRYFVIYTLIIFTVFVLVGTILNRLLKGESTDLFIDIPPLRVPQLKNILNKTYSKTKMFISEATPLFALGALLISVMQYFGILVKIQEFVAPLTVGWLKLPRETATAFIMGFVRRDFGAAGLYSIPMSDNQTLVALITMTLFVPCIAATMVIFKERSKKEALWIWIGSFIIAFLVGGIVAQIIM